MAPVFIHIAFFTMQTLHLLALLEQLSTALATAWAFASELITAAALLWCLNTLASLIRLTYESGLWVGHFTKRYLIPLLLKAADGISYLNAQIDWDHVRNTLRMVITTAVAAVITLFTVIIPAAYLWIERNFIDVPVASERPAPCKSTQPAARGFAPVQRRRHGRLIAC